MAAATDNCKNEYHGYSMLYADFICRYNEGKVDSYDQKRNVLSVILLICKMQSSPILVAIASCMFDRYQHQLYNIVVFRYTIRLAV